MLFSCSEAEIGGVITRSENLFSVTPKLIINRRGNLQVLWQSVHVKFIRREIPSQWLILSWRFVDRTSKTTSVTRHPYNYFIVSFSVRTRKSIIPKKLQAKSCVYSRSKQPQSEWKIFSCTRVSSINPTRSADREPISSRLIPHGRPLVWPPRELIPLCTQHTGFSSWRRLRPTLYYSAAHRKLANIGRLRMQLHC